MERKKATGASCLHAIDIDHGGTTAGHTLKGLYLHGGGTSEKEDMSAGDWQLEGQLFESLDHRRVAREEAILRVGELG